MFLIHLLDLRKSLQVEESSSQ